MTESHTAPSCAAWRCSDCIAPLRYHLPTNGQPSLVHSSTTILPRNSASDTRWPLLSVAVKTGAGWLMTGAADVVRGKTGAPRPTAVSRRTARRFRGFMIDLTSSCGGKLSSLRAQRSNPGQHTSACHAQGNRISKQGQELGEICVVPSGAFEFAAKGSFGGILLHHVQRHVSQHREVVWPVAQSAPVLILVHDDIEPPV